MIKTIFKISVVLSLCVVASLGLFLVWATLTRWVPEAKINLAIKNPAPQQEEGAVRPPPFGRELTMVTWNIGYAGLDREADFFLDGGDWSRARSIQVVEENLAGIETILASLSADFTLLQEVDRRASRTFAVDEMMRLDRAYKEQYWRGFADNYRVGWVPVPWTHPMGSVWSGLFAVYAWQPIQLYRQAVDSTMPWPDRLFMLQRAWMEARFPLIDTSELIVINLHLSAFDKGGKTRARQLAQLRQYIVEESGLGNRLLVGGDWNSRLPGGVFPPCGEDQDGLDWLFDLPADWTPGGWHWATPDAPTVRTLGAPLSPATTCYATIDGVLVSPGIEIRSVHTIDARFRFSDHNPVITTVRLIH